MNENNFEVSIKKLEETVKRLESGELSLDESMKAFEEGVSLVRKCRTLLNEAEQKVKNLLEEQND